MAEVGYLDEEIVSLHCEIVELRRSPFARSQGDVMGQLSVFQYSVETVIFSNG